MSTCKHCGKEVLTEERAEAIAEVAAADRGFDGGEFSGSFDYYSGFCDCSPEEAEPADK